MNRGAFAANPARIEYLLSPALFTAVDAGAVDFILIDADIALWAAPTSSSTPAWPSRSAPPT